jgi:preprotein translocase subunit SecE
VEERLESEEGKQEGLMATIVEQNALTTTLKSWPVRIKTFYNDVRTEMKKVTAPSFKEVRATTTVVIITVFLFGVYFFVIDNVIGKAVDYTFRSFTHR